MNERLKRVISFTIILALCFTLMAAFATTEAQAAGKTHLKKSSLMMEAGDTYQQKLILANGKVVSPSKVKWKSTNKWVVTISSKGKVKAKHHGTAKLKAAYKGKTYTFKVTVKDYNFQYSEYNIEVGKSKKVRFCKYTPKEVISPEKVEFWSEDDAVATVSQSGKVTGVSEGETEIYAEYKGKTYSCTAIIKKKPEPPKTGSIVCTTSLPCVCISKWGPIFRVDSITANLVKENKGVTIEMALEGVYTGNTKGNNEAYPDVNYRIYDSSGYVVASSSFPTFGKLRVGDKTKAEWFVYISEGSPTDDYTIEIYGDVEGLSYPSQPSEINPPSTDITPPSSNEKATVDVNSNLPLLVTDGTFNTSVTIENATVTVDDFSININIEGTVNSSYNGGTYSYVSYRILDSSGAVVTSKLYQISGAASGMRFNETIYEPASKLTKGEKYTLEFYSR